MLQALLVRPVRLVRPAWPVQVPVALWPSAVPEVVPQTVREEQAVLPWSAQPAVLQEPVPQLWAWLVRRQVLRPLA